MYSLRAINTDTGVITGQKQAKNGPKWSKLAFSSNKSFLSRVFSFISPNPVRTRSNMLIDSFENKYGGHNGPKTGQKRPQMVKIGIFISCINVIQNFFVNLTQCSHNRPKTDQKWPKMAKINVFILSIIVI